MRASDSIFPAFQGFSTILTNTIGPGYTSNLFSAPNLIYGFSDFFSIVRAREAIEDFEKTLKRWREGVALQRFHLSDIRTIASLSLVLRPLCLLTAGSAVIFQNASTVLVNATFNFQAVRYMPAIYGGYKVLSAMWSPVSTFSGWSKDLMTNFADAKNAILAREFKTAILPGLNFILNSASPILLGVSMLNMSTYLWQPSYSPKVPFDPQAVPAMPSLLARSYNFLYFYGACCFVKDMITLAIDKNSLVNKAANAWVGSMRKLVRRDFANMTAYDYAAYISTLAAVIGGAASLAITPAGFSWLAVANYFQHYNLAVNIIRTLFDDAEWGWRYSYKQNLWELSKKVAQIGFMYYFLPKIIQDGLYSPFRLIKSYIPDGIIEQIGTAINGRQILSSLSSFGLSMPAIITASYQSGKFLPPIMIGGTAIMALYATWKAKAVNSTPNDVSKAAPVNAKALQIGYTIAAVLTAAFFNTTALNNYSLYVGVGAGLSVLASSAYYAYGGKKFIKYAEQILPTLSLAYLFFANEFMSLAGLPVSKILLSVATYKVIKHTFSQLHFDSDKATLGNIGNSLFMGVTAVAAVAVGFTLFSCTSALSGPTLIAYSLAGLTSFNVAIYNARGILNSLFRRYEPHQTNAETLIEKIQIAKDKIEAIQAEYNKHADAVFNPIKAEITNLLANLAAVRTDLDQVKAQSVPYAQLAANIPANMNSITAQITNLHNTVNNLRNGHLNLEHTCQGNIYNNNNVQQNTQHLNFTKQQRGLVDKVHNESILKIINGLQNLDKENYIAR